MNLTVIDKSNFTLKVNKELFDINEQNKKEQINKIIILLRKRYLEELQGFYEIKIYDVNNFITILKFKKKDNDDYYGRNINFKITEYKKNISLEFDDFTLVKKYKDKKVNSDKISKKDIYKLCEHYKIVI